MVVGVLGSLACVWGFINNHEYWSFVLVFVVVQFFLVVAGEYYSFFVFCSFNPDYLFVFSLTLFKILVSPYNGLIADVIPASQRGVSRSLYFALHLLFPFDLHKLQLIPSYSAVTTAGF